jgi:hypothetical protein
VEEYEALGHCLFVRFSYVAGRADAG